MACAGVFVFADLSRLLPPPRVAAADGGDRDDAVREAAVRHITHQNPLRRPVPSWWPQLTPLVDVVTGARPLA